MIDIVLQGGLNAYAVEVAEYYSTLPFLSRIILSCWDNDPEIKYNGCLHPKIVFLRNKPVFPGLGNRNLQIKSSYEGLKRSHNHTAVKMRNDQKVSLESMHLMNDYYEQHKQPPSIFVPGIFPTFPFHPRDHIFWGATTDLINLFDIPLDTESLSDDYNLYMRSEAYICMWYYGKKNELARHMVLNKEEYLLDNSPRRNESIALTKELNLFRPFPKIDFEWPKYGMKEYHYQYTKDVYGEYQAEDFVYNP